MLQRALLLAFGVSMAGVPAWAESFSRISDRDAFIGTVSGKELRLGLFGIALTVEPDGDITGRAMGWDIVGTWEWQDGYFCREMDWSGKPIPYNCQLVETNDGRIVRFTVDRGTGDSAQFRLR